MKRNTQLDKRSKQKITMHALSSKLSKLRKFRIDDVKLRQELTN